MKSIIGTDTDMVFRIAVFSNVIAILATIAAAIAGTVGTASGNMTVALGGIAFGIIGVASVLNAHLVMIHDAIRNH